MKNFFSLLFLVTIALASTAQRFSKADATFLAKKEDTLKVESAKILYGINASDRVMADSLFTRVLVRALNTRNSFYHPFDSLETISKLYAPDSSFRIFTWHMLVNDNLTRQRGAIQMRTADGSLKLFPLIDKSDVTVNMQDTIAGNLAWMGAIYYKIIPKKHLNHTYYTLLGYDENNIRSSKKLIEILDFVNDKPLFGGRYFNIAGSEIAAKNPSRIIMEFKKDANPRLTFDESMDMIVMEHLVSQSNEPQKKWTLIPDGDYEAFKWTNGKWLYINKIFNEVTPDGQAPVPVPFNENKMNTNVEGEIK